MGFRSLAMGGHPPEESAMTSPATGRRVAALAAGLMAIGTAGPSAAVDGVIEINQAKVEASGGFPYTISQLGSYRLTSNLIIDSAGTTAIRVTASNVTVDLNGFVISGVTVCSGSPVTGCAPPGAGRGIDGETAGGGGVRNGVVRGMGGEGIALGPAGRVEDVRVVSNGGRGVVVGVSSRVSDASVLRNGASGIELGADSSVSDSVVLGNGVAGISFAAQTEIIGNVVSANGQTGIPGESGIVASGSNNTIVNNVASQNGYAGIAASQDNVVTENAVTQNGDFGMRLSGGNTIEGNAVFDNQAGGIRAAGGSALLGNAIHFNQGPGVELSGTQTGLSDNVITDNSSAAITPAGSFLEIGGNVCGTNLTCP
jgi:parallel beta-helix repeat protein